MGPGVLSTIVLSTIEKLSSSWRSKNEKWSLFFLGGGGGGGFISYKLSFLDNYRKRSCPPGEKEGLLVGGSTPSTVTDHHHFVEWIY